MARPPRFSTARAPPPSLPRPCHWVDPSGARVCRGHRLAYAAIAGLSILLGLLVTRVLITNGPVARGDEALVRFLSHHRSGGLTEASLIGSIIAGGVTLPILVAVFGLLAALFRQWRLAAFLIFALAVESAAYRTTTLVVHRHRPKVVRLENLPANASYPSGHTAAAIVVYCGLALLLTSRIAARRARIAIWACAAAIPVYVAFSRMYRGMHHPLDVAGGVFIGVATLVAMVIVSRASGPSRRCRRRPAPIGGSRMSKVAVIAHAGKSFGGGLPEFRQRALSRGVTDPLWFEIQKSRHAPPRVERALEAGADLIFVWGGDGTVQRCIDTVGRDRAQRLRSCRPARRTSSPRISRSPTRSRPRSRSASTGSGESSTSAASARSGSA